MKMAKASKEDLDMAMELTSAFEALAYRWNATLPAAMVKDGDEEADDSFDRDNDRQCGEVLRHLLDVVDRGSLMRVTWGCAVMLDPANKCVDPDADTIEHHPYSQAGHNAMLPRPLADWTESTGAVLWWQFPATEAPYVGTPTAADWPGLHTHWTPLIVPAPPQPVQATLPGVPSVEATQ